ARQFLERLVWFGQPVTPHESLNRLGDDLPRLLSLEILGDAPLVDLDALKPALQRLQRDDQMPERRTHRSYRRAVGEIALPSRDRQLGRQVIEQRARDSKVALAVLEVDWIDLVRHHRRAGLSRDGFLREVTDRDVAPHVAAEAEQDRVDAHHDAEQLGDKIVAL